MCWCAGRGPVRVSSAPALLAVQHSRAAAAAASAAPASRGGPYTHVPPALLRSQPQPGSHGPVPAQEPPVKRQPGAGVCIRPAGSQGQFWAPGCGGKRQLRAARPPSACQLRAVQPAQPSVRQVSTDIRTCSANCAPARMGLMLVRFFCCIFGDATGVGCRRTHEAGIQGDAEVS